MRLGRAGVAGMLALATLAMAANGTRASAGAQASPGAQAPAAPQAPSGAQPAGDPVFAVTFRTGPAWDAAKPPAEQLHFADHSRNLRQLRADGRILLGGRFGEVGLVLLRAKSEDEARSLVERDPAIQAGTFKAEIHRWSPFMGGCTGTDAR